MTLLTGTITQGKYGRTQHAVPRPLHSGRGYVRDDEYTDSDGDTTLSVIHCAGPEDDSRPFSETHGDRYEGACGWCWLGVPHTLSAHAAHLAIAEDKQ